MVKERTKKIILVYLALLIPTSLLLYPLWGIQLLLWSGLFYIITNNKWDQLLPAKLAQAFFITAIIYPALELLIKFAIIYNFIPYSWIILNRIEHSLFGFAMFFLLLPITYKLAKKEIFLAAFVSFLLVNLIGNLNEIFEFALRSYWAMQSRFASYYSDTVIDIIMNALGSGLAFLASAIGLKTNKR